MRGGERREIGEDRGARFLQTLDRMMAGRDQRARDAEFLCDFEIMQRVADEEDFIGCDAESGHEVASERDLAVRMDVVEAGNMIEVGREAEVRYDFVKRLVPVGRKD